MKQYDTEIRCSNCYLFSSYKINKGVTIGKFKEFLKCANCGCNV